MPFGLSDNLARVTCVGADQLTRSAETWEQLYASIDDIEPSMLAELNDGAGGPSLVAALQRHIRACEAHVAAARRMRAKLARAVFRNEQGKDADHE